MVALAVLPQRDSTFVSYSQSVMCLDLPAPLPSYKHGRVAGALASPPLCLWSSNTAASKPAAAREGGAWVADTDLEARAEMWRFSRGPGQLLNT